MIFSAEYCTEGGLSYDDIDLWARLRSMTLIKVCCYFRRIFCHHDPMLASSIPSMHLRSPLADQPQGLEIPPKIRAYLDYFEAKGDVPLYDVMAV